ncbi:hypothetical protein NOF04DRAFT_21383 [Fusarium oxysporum II5]|uniref:Protein kinase domain-containing protein n=2 Tax=Fusarium oxysporum species complex TaxID=171631 RepID=X0JQJ4_FUSO5|nr:uncharacterized protein FOIG_06270 [Fusarium odoratissimum NRRL 54006]EXM03468.1 hypothetical protein FOIG_06270 [Fusarium odoratissimum NRRL 54006]KAH7207064.1 hypothetical protein DER44DRAFT_778599 [Fusarium oxysporum]KAK2134632.1 hypothetical protein NOF04DRAFT_21383 [Fusarium oxysporum II5]TXC11724.1 hypothetical protein FocTR4_00007507 [Fusarium oxysporum f. sp. cubense]
MADLALGIAGLVVGVPGLIQVIGLLGDAVLKRLGHYDDNYQRRVKLLIRISKSQTQDLLLYLERLGDKAPEALVAEVHDMFQALRDALELLVTMLPSVGIDEAAVVRTKLSEAKKASIDAEVAKIEEWNNRILKRMIVLKFFGNLKALPPTSADDEVAPSLRKVEKLRDSIKESLDKAKSDSTLLLNPPEEASCTLLPNSILQLKTPKTGGRPFLAECRVYSDNASEREIQQHRQVIREVARILRQADPAFMGLLNCSGFLWDSLECRFELHFPITENMENPRSLLNLLLDPMNKKARAKHPLNHRITLAKSVVVAIFILHSAGFVHKQIRPDNIVIFDKAPDTSLSTGTVDPAKQIYPYSIGTPFLVGFDNVRKVDAASLMLPIEEWEKTIYLSPERQRLQPGDEFNMRHDLYSLGVVLLEIAFWASFQDKKSSQLGKIIWRDAGQSDLCGPEELKKIYMSLAKGSVPRVIGQKYADVVMACLTGLESEKDMLNELKDKDGIIIGTRYILEIIKKLEEISL